jgi:hypothetical protein
VDRNANRRADGLTFQIDDKAWKRLKDSNWDTTEFIVADLRQRVR